ARLLDRELDRRILDGLHHGAAQRDLDLAGLVRELDLDVRGGAVLLAHRAGEAGLEGLDEQRAIHALLARDLTQRVQDLVVHRLPPRSRLRRVFPPAPSFARPFRISSHGFSITSRAERTPSHANQCSLPSSSRTPTRSPSGPSRVPSKCRRPSLASWVV